MNLLIITQKVDQDDDVLGFFTGWIRAVAKRVKRVKVICLARGRYDLPDNVQVVSLGKEKGLPKIVQALLFYFHSLRFLPGANGIFVHMAPEYVKALYPLNLFFRKPIIMWYAHINVSPLAQWAIKKVNYILTPSKESFKYDSPKVVSTGHGIDTAVFKPIFTELKADVLALSRISKVKRIEVLIEAVRILAEKTKNISVDIYGKPARPEDEAYFAELKGMVEKFGLQKNISWKDSVANENTPQIYASHKVFVRMQGGGGFGKTELEAMSMGVPAIVPTDVYQKNLGEFAQDLYFEENNASMFAERIMSVLAWSNEKREKYAKVAREIVIKNHNVENVAQKIVELIKSCAE